MAPRCSICAHPESFAINEAVVIERKSNRVIARQYGVGHDSVQRHKAHIPELLLKAQENMDAYDAASILAKIRDLEEETLEQLQGAKDDEAESMVSHGGDPPQGRNGSSAVGREPEHGRHKPI